MKRQSTIRPSAIYFSSIVKLRVRVRACNQSVLTNKGTVSSSRKQREPLMAFELTTDRLLIRQSTLPTVPPHPLMCVRVKYKALSGACRYVDVVSYFLYEVILTSSTFNEVVQTRNASSGK